MDRLTCDKCGRPGKSGTGPDDERMGSTCGWRLLDTRDWRRVRSWRCLGTMLKFPLRCRMRANQA